MIAEIEPFTGEWTDEEIRRVHLQAAAPELRDALTELIESHRSLLINDIGRNSGCYCGETIGKCPTCTAENVINKAKGFSL